MKFCWLVIFGRSTSWNDQCIDSSSGTRWYGSYKPPQKAVIHTWYVCMRYILPIVWLHTTWAPFTRTCKKSIEMMLASSGHQEVFIFLCLGDPYSLANWNGFLSSWLWGTYIPQGHPEFQAVSCSWDLKSLILWTSQNPTKKTESNHPVFFGSNDF